MKPGNLRKRILLLLAVAAILVTVSLTGGEMTERKLTPEEEGVIVGKGTEPPFSGIYDDHWEKGTYTCKRCGAPLYRSDDKFQAGCGWPGFDDEIPGAVERSPDPDGRRTEISCTACGAHLGHIFTGEGFTGKNVRHCVNSISLVFVPAEEDHTTETAYFAGGCFWGVEYHFEETEGVLSTRSGYMGGHTSDPTYEEVCTGTTGHAETVEVVFDPSKVTYEELARLFFEIHDPTQLDRQGPDVGSQYRSMVFWTNEQQKETAVRLVEILRARGYDIVTRIEKAGPFRPAEDYHQDYYRKRGQGPACHLRTHRF